MKFRCAVSVLGFVLIASSRAHAADFTVCADPDPPPWSTWVRDSQGKPTGKFVGFSVDLVTAAFGRIGKTVEFIGNLPWSRCLLQTESGEIDFAMDGYYSEDRARRFAFSAHYNTLSPQVFFLADSDVKVSTKSDLKRYRGCGMLGASYGHYGLDPSELDLGVATYEGTIRKLMARRCQYFVEELEVITGLWALGRIPFDQRLLSSSAVRDASAPSKHLLTAKGGRGEKVLRELDVAINALIASGEAAKMWRPWAPAGLDYKP